MEIYAFCFLLTVEDETGDLFLLETTKTFLETLWSKNFVEI